MRHHAYPADIAHPDRRISHHFPHPRSNGLSLVLVTDSRSVAGSNGGVMRIGGWNLGAKFSLSRLMLGLAWETAPLSVYLALPFIGVSVERDDRHSDGAWPWCWSLCRLTVRKTEFRLDLDLHIWQLGLNIPDAVDFALYIGPLNIQIETGKGYRWNCPPCLPTLRLLFPRSEAVIECPGKCRIRCGDASQGSPGRPGDAHGVG